MLAQRRFKLSKVETIKVDSEIIRIIIEIRETMEILEIEIIGTISQGEIIITLETRVDSGPTIKDSMETVIIVAFMAIELVVAEKHVTPTIKVEVTPHRIKTLTAALLLKVVIQETISRVSTIIRYQLM